MTRDATPVNPGRGPLSAPQASRAQGTTASPALSRAQAAPGEAPAAVIAAGAQAKAAQENFPVAFRVLPARYRRHLMAVYRFARTVDDIGDEALPGTAIPPSGTPIPLAGTATPLAGTATPLAGATPRAGTPTPRVGAIPLAGTAIPRAGATPRAGDDTAERIRLLDELDDDLSRLYSGRAARLEVIAGLAPTVTECGVPDQLLRDLIQANRQDQLVTRYQSFDDLLGYCKLSANPVGRIVLHVFGAQAPRRARLSDYVCTALQLAEHWQDVAEDARAGRIYLPLEDMAAFGCTESDLAGPTADPRLRALMEFQVVRASAMLSVGSPLIAMLHGAARVAVAGYVAGGRAALAAIEDADHDVLAATPRPAKRRLAAELARAYTRGR